eukprot:scaffold58993_cov34-Tisochrysis_lutea.AAC.2
MAHGATEEADNLRASLLERYAPMLERMLARPQRSQSEQMTRLRQRMKNALEHLQTPATSLESLCLLDSFLEELERKLSIARNRKYTSVLPPPDNPAVASPGCAAAQPELERASSCKPLAQSGLPSDPSSGAVTSAPMPSLLSVLESSKRQRISSFEDEVLSTLRNIMYTHGDAEHPLEDSTQEVMRHLRAWLSDLLPLVTVAARTAAHSPSIEGDENPPKQSSCEESQVAQSTLNLSRLTSNFPKERSRYSALLASRKNVERSTSEESVMEPSDEADLLGEHVELETAECLEQNGANEGSVDSLQQSASIAHVYEQRQAFADLRTRDMGLSEYEEFVRRRRSSSLGTIAFARWCRTAFGLGGSKAQIRTHVPEVFSFLGWLARCRVAEIVEEANRNLHGGKLAPLKNNTPIHKEQYAKASNNLVGITVGLDRQ